VWSFGYNKTDGQTLADRAEKNKTKALI